MNDRRTALAILLSIIVVLVYTEVVFRPYATPKNGAPSTQQDARSVAAGSAAPVVRGASGEVAAEQVAEAGPSLDEVRQAGFTIIETDLVRAHISNLGGRLISLQLLNYAREQGSEERVDLVDPRADVLPLGLQLSHGSDARIMYRAAEPSSAADGEVLRAGAGERVTLVLRGEQPTGAQIEKRFTFIAGTYFIEIEANPESAGAAENPAFEWTSYVTPEQLSMKWNAGWVKLLNAANKLETAPATEIVAHEAEQAPGISTTNGIWGSYGDTYFLSALIPSATPATFTAVTLPAEDGAHRLSLKADPAELDGKVLLYAGPKDSRILEAAGHQLERTIDLGVFSFIAFPLLWLMRAFEMFVGNWGLAIILLTLFVKTVFLPLNVTSFRSMRAMQDLQPEMKALRERIKDPTQLNQELLALYKRRGVNPMGGCLPILIQIPVFFGLFNLLPNAIELRHAPFALWVTDLSSPERLEVFGMAVPLMTLLFVGSMFVQQWMMPAVGDPMQRKIMLIVPVIIGISFIVYPFPAGLVIYWLVNNTVSIIQQAYIRSDKSGSPLKATLIAGTLIFALGYVLTLI